MPEWLGKTIGKVRIEKLLARGGMAEVYLGTHLTLERLVAVKVLHSFIEEEPNLLERFHREAKVVAGLRHPNIVQIFDFDTTDGHPFIVMEYLKGPTLATYLRHLHHRKKRLPQDQIARLLQGLAGALGYAHGRGVIHRDIKPGNIMLHNREDEIPLDKPLPDDVEAVVTDFGLVRVVNAASQTISGFLSGTPTYASPEQARGDETDHRSDIYSLGVVLYEMLAGRVPFEAENAVTILHMHIHATPPPIPGITAQVQEVVDRALQKNPDDRFQTGQEMSVQFDRAIGMSAQPAGMREPNLGSPIPMNGSMGGSIPSPAMLALTEVDSPPDLKPGLPASPSTIKPVPSAVSTPETEPPPVSALGKVPGPRPARTGIWIAMGLFSLVLIALFGVGALRFLASRPPSPKPTQAAGPALPGTTAGPSPSATPSLPGSEGMVNVAAGKYEVGRALIPADDYHVAPKTVDLDEFWIDQFPVTGAQYQQFIAQTNAPPPPVTNAGDHPVIGVTWDQASAYCSWANKRLPDEAEWEAAGRGPGAAPQLYPWSNDPTANGQALDLPDQNTYAVGTQAFNHSLLGVFDMVGNIWEWVGQPYADIAPGFRILRGGRFGLPINDLAYRLVVTSDDTRYVRYAGFRCAADQVK
ncbi:MAG TPA: SUMF1/EgtB/PvdO family nonheme iron enzyme [Anaerolineales bacterium]